ncbi:hypothetical protein [Petrocella sp. FN5]|uniref:hypothetical protein n=1 Tax=Petrocella sp. FN5 TaxID=3032002 RepID=UPI0023DC22F3|nr:hypothetical protein [Petrocella sp. FN5]MDF1617519.1 hypothetical protein [Petrocella sp. FN5]
MFKKMVVGLSLLFLCVVIGFTIPFIMSNQNPSQEVDLDVLKKQFEQELETMQEQKLRENYEAMWDEHMDNNPKELEDLLDEMELLNKSQLETNIEEETVIIVSPDRTGTIEDSSTDTLPDEEVDFFDLETVPLSDGEVITEKVVKDQWVNEKIHTHKDQIADSDLSAGAGIYNRLDTNYLFSLAEGGLSAEKEEEAKAYLRANLSEAELGKAIELYNKYVHLLN